MSESQYIFQLLEQEYKITIDNTNPAPKRLSSANRIAQKIINYALNKDERVSDKNAISEERERKIVEKEILKPEFKDRPYRDDFYGSLDFLCDLGYIPANLKYAFGLLLSRGDENSKHAGSGTISEISFLSIHEILNNVLGWFLNAENQSDHYLIPVKFRSKNEPELQEENEQEITTFWNIKENERNWFKKYRTPLSYAIVLLPFIFIIYVVIEQNYLYKYDIYLLDEMDELTLIYLVSLIYIPSVLIGIVELYKTYRYATKKMVRLFRYLLFGIIIIPIILSASFNYFGFSFNPEEQHGAFLDSDPNNDGGGFLSLTTHNCLPTVVNSCREKLFSLDSVVVPKGEDKMFDLRMELKNIGNKSLDSSRFHLFYFLPNENTMLIEANVHNSMENSIHDVVTLVGFEKGTALIYSGSKTVFSIQEVDSNGIKVFRDSVIYSQFQKDFKKGHVGLLPTLNPVYQSKIKKVSIIFTIRFIERNTDHGSNEITGYRIGD